MALSTRPQDTVIPIVEEAAHVERTVVETGAVRVRVHTERRTEAIDEPTLLRGVSVERVARDTLVEERRDPWMDGDVVVVPVYRDIVVRKTLLVEEVRLTPTVSVQPERQSFELTSESAVFERQLPDGTWREVPFADLAPPR